MSTIDTDGDLQISRIGQGIKLLRPARNARDYQSVSRILKLPFQVYFENTERLTLQSNEIYAEVNGFNTHQECIGEKWFKPFNEKTVIPTLQNDRSVIVQNKYIITEETGLRKDETEVHTLSIRMPWYNDKNNIIGLFGLSISLGKMPLADSLLQIAELGFLYSPNKIENTIGSEINNVYLSKRQLQCAKLLLDGYTAKEISSSLNLSTRTVEGYINVIKTKLACYNRSELILKLSGIFNIAK